MPRRDKKETVSFHLRSFCRDSFASGFLQLSGTWLVGSFRSVSSEVLSQRFDPETEKGNKMSRSYIMSPTLS